MTNKQKQKCVDQMGEQIFERFAHFIEIEDVDTARALHEEWNVNGQDPEDGSYEFMFINDLTAAWDANLMTLPQLVYNWMLKQLGIL